MRRRVPRGRCSAHLDGGRAVAEDAADGRPQVGQDGGDDALWAEVRAVAYRALRGKRIDHADAEDAAQETMLDLAEAIRRGEQLRNPAGWAAVVARRRATDLLREDRVRHGLPARQDEEEREVERAAAQDSEGASASDGPDHERSSEPSSERTADDSSQSSARGRTISVRRSVEHFLLHGEPTSLVALQRGLIDELVALLDEETQQMIWLVAEGLSQEEIAAELGLKKGTVKKRLQRKRAELVELAGERGIDIDFRDHPRGY